MTGPAHLTAVRAGHDALAGQYAELSQAALDTAEQIPQGFLLARKRS